MTNQYNGPAIEEVDQTAQERPLLPLSAETHTYPGNAEAGIRPFEYYSLPLDANDASAYMTTLFETDSDYYVVGYFINHDAAGNQLPAPRFAWSLDGPSHEALALALSNDDKQTAKRITDNDLRLQAYYDEEDFEAGVWPNGILLKGARVDYVTIQAALFLGVNITDPNTPLTIQTHDGRPGDMTAQRRHYHGTVAGYYRKVQTALSAGA